MSEDTIRRMADWPVHPRKKKRLLPSTASQGRKAAVKLSAEKTTSPELSAAGRALSARRMVKMTKKQRSAIASHAASSYWASMSEKERKIEMRRRHKIMMRRRRAAKQEKIRAGK